MSDQKLVDIMDLIKGALEGADIAGFVILHNAPGELETATYISPSYSVASFKDSGNGLALRIHSMKADYTDDPERQNRDMEATLSMLSGFGEIAAQNALCFLQAVEAVKKAIPDAGIEQTPLRRTDGRSQ